MIKDPWNPTPDEITEWAFSKESWPEQDWDLAVTDGNNDSLLLVLACDSRCPNQRFFLHSLYLMIGDAVHRAAPKERMDQLQAMISSINESHPFEVQRWKAETIELLSNPSTFEYRYWCGHMFYNSESKQPIT